MLKRKYFERRQEATARYVKDISEIRAYLSNLGTLDATDVELEKLYSEFSENCYCAGWLCVSDDILEHFANWLERYEG